MSEQPGAGDAPSIPDNPTTIPDAPRVVPLAALESERKARQELADRLAKIEADRAAAEKAEAEKRGEYERLYKESQADRDAKAARLAELEAIAAQAATRQAERQQAKISTLPDHLKALVPAKLTGDDLDEFLMKLEGMVSATAATATAPAQGIPPGRTGGSGDPDALTGEEEAWAQSLGYLGVATNSTIKRAFQKANHKRT